ncbi:LysR family transcriptional regulator, partial [Klebsiella pneumoniae]|nr:LysR family transcriptional regulator [Klebsiella pneumoniae]
MNIMHPVLRRIDLNLLPVFDAVYRSRSVRLAAEELAMSTSALSHALSRLRSALNDPLFYREGHWMCPSVYASQLAPSIASALKFLNQELTPPAAFVPAASTDCMQIAITDFTAFCVFPTLMHHLQREAPGLRFELRYLPHSPALTELLAGEVDLALGFNTPDEPAHPDLEEINWLRDEYVVISQANRTALTLDAYLAARHLVVTPWNERQGVLDCELERQGYSRQVAMKTPSMLSAPFIIEQSDLLMA